MLLKLLVNIFFKLDIGELILKILKGDIESPGNFSSDAVNLLKELLNTDSDKRPDINAILEKPYLLKYIKLNLIKKLTSPEKTLYINEPLVSPNNRSNTSSECLNFQYNSIPHSFNSDSYIGGGFASKEITIKELEKDYSGSSLFINKSEDGGNEDGSSTFCKIEKLKSSLEKYLGFDNFVDIYLKISVIRLLIF
jgi:hypothetical protein